jgi:hypothetical protein
MREPHDPKVCPACGSGEVLHGSIGLSDGSGAQFYPSGLPLLTLERSVRLMAGTRFFGCRACDLIWSNAVPGHLAQLVPVV